MDDRLPAPNTDAQETPLPGIRFTARRMMWIAVLAAATVAVLLTLGDAPATLNTVRHVDWRLIGLAVLIHYSGFAVRGHRWMLLLRAAGHRLGYLRVTSVLLGGWFVSALLPARLGEVFRIAALRLPPRPSHEPVPVADSLSTIILERALDIFALLVLSAGFGYLALGAALPPWVGSVYIAALAVLALLALALLLAPGILDWLRGLSDKRWWTAAVGFAHETVTSLRTLPASPRIAAAAAVESLYIWLCDALLLWLVLLAVAQQVTLASAGFVALTVDISAAIPLTPGGVGQIEAAYAVLLALFAVAPSGISAAVLLARLITYWSFLLLSGGVLFAAGLGNVVFTKSQTATASATKADADSS